MPAEHAEPSCFHCGLPVPRGLDLSVEINGKPQPMCCHGCEAVAQAIVDSGMESYYNYRTENAAKAREVVPAFLEQLKAYDNPVVQKRFVHQQDNLSEVSLILEGIVCAACVWLNERHLSSLPGVAEVNINYSNHRAHVRWDDSKISLSDILESISRIGYLAHPYDPDRQQRIIEKERKAQLRRIGLSGVLGMQVMILAVALYTGEWWGIDEAFRGFFRWTSLLLTIPVLLFASRIFFTAAWRDLKQKRAGMDVPVSLGIAIAFTASVAHTVTASGDIYFDSVVMFTFFLLSARYFEMTARKRSNEATEAVVSLQPAVAAKLVRVDGKDEEQAVPVAELEPGDRVLVRPGETIPADGTIESGASGVNESLITGESMPITKSAGDEVIGGSINTESPLIIGINRIGADTVLAAIQRLLDKAQSEKPAVAQLADRIASKFVLAILFIAASVAIFWLAQSSENWLPITIATLVVTCPCALSLATPTAITAASGQLAKLGLLPTRGHALETLSRATHFVFDKTGTLTIGHITLTDIQVWADLSRDDCLQIAAALEQHSEHPIARSFKHACPNSNRHAVEVSNTPGRGISGTVDAQVWYLGKPAFVMQYCCDDSIVDDSSGQTRVVLATTDKIYAVFTFADAIREDAATLIQNLKASGKTVVLLTGDNKSTAKHVASATGINEVHASLRPEDKLAYLKRLQQQGAIVSMTGDGVNDAPVLAGADVSIAIGSGSQLAAASADFILLSSKIGTIYSGYRLSVRTLSVIRQNLMWAIGYNILAVPAAAMGYIQPWLAAIGMSASSLVVVLNALRLSKPRGPQISIT
ncbi:MAG: cadmium-translocating P-type ATPase [Gammaproteobacteria bacterium]|nr:cadmium-translocating P-type ATPase [Gammaproteobacteria bacterium]